MKIRQLFLIIICCTCILGCANLKPLMNDDIATMKALEVLQTMTLEEKIGQLFFINPEAFSSVGYTYNDLKFNRSGITVVDENLIQSIKEYPVGGIIYFGRNIESPTQLKKFSKDLQKSTKFPLFIGIDEEGGRVARISKNENFNVAKIPSMEELTRKGRTSNVKNASSKIGGYLKKYGINVNFAPVVDINTNPDNIIIGDRAFSDDPYVVAEMSSAYIDGLHKNKIISAIKHFPGHGDTKGDTHDGYVYVNKTWEELHNTELIPFIYNFNKTDMIMVSHITTPNITTDWRPSSLSPQMIQSKLRDELGYNGVVITDAMDMGAISEDYSSANGAIRAIEAGVDIVLVPYNFKNAFYGLLNAVKNGRISESRIDESVTRILTLKMKYNLFRN